MIRNLLAGLVLVASLVPPVSGAERIARIAVLSSGRVQLDGRPTTVPALDEELRKLKSDKGVVKHQLPVSMSTKPDFSDYVDDKGVSRPRTR
jgi:hypothetical protein